MVALHLRRTKQQQQEQQEDETNMTPHMNPKTPPGVSKVIS